MYTFKTQFNKFGCLREIIGANSCFRVALPKTCGHGMGVARQYAALVNLSQTIQRGFGHQMLSCFLDRNLSHGDSSLLDMGG